MLKEKFSFVLSEDVLEDSHGAGEGITFNAKLVSDFEYHITWDDGTNMGIEGTDYTVSQVESAINEGYWVLV